MPKDNAWMWIIGAVVVVMLMTQDAETPTTPPPSTNGGIDLCKLVDSETSFTGQRMFKEGTSLTDEQARVIKNDGTRRDLGNVSLNSGTLSTTPGGAYKVYFYEPSTTYYTQIVDYTAPCQDATDDLVGQGCTMDATPTITIFDEYNNLVTATASAQALGIDEEKSIKIRIRVSADQCFGNPSVDGQNALCFRYNTTVIESIKAGTLVNTPYSITSNFSHMGHKISCYGFDTLKDNDEVDIIVDLKGSASEPGVTHNVTTWVEDVAFDLDADSLAEIVGFQDEDNNDLGTGALETHLFIT